MNNGMGAEPRAYLATAVSVGAINEILNYVFE